MRPPRSSRSGGPEASVRASARLAARLPAGPPTGPPTGTPARSPAGLAALSVLAVVAILGADGLPDAARAQDIPALADTSDAPLDVQFFPPAVSTYGLVWVPIGTASESRGLGGGLKTVLPYQLEGDPDSPASELALEFLVTLEGQQRLELTSDLLWDAGRNYVRLRLDYDGLARRFYGLGPAADQDDREYYKPHQLLSYVEGARQLGGGVAVGPRFEVHRQMISDIDRGGVLDCGHVCTAFDVTEIGAGGIFRVDRRDVRYWPTRGLFLQGQLMAFSHGLGGAHDFTVFNADLRGYWSPAPHQVLAGQLFYYGVNGQPPFWRLASLGGRHHSRAYVRDRWLDRVMTAAQVEWRWRARQRVGMTVFGGVAVVGEDVASLRARYLRPSVGLGLRVYTGRGPEAVPLRLDLAFGYQAARVSVGIGEAF